MGSEQRTFFRGRAQAGQRVDVRYAPVRASNKENAVLNSVTANVGIGGAFILTDSPLPEGTQLSLELQLPNVPPVRVQGQVRWVARKDVDAHVCMGMGIQFSDLDPNSRASLRNYFCTLLPSPRNQRRPTNGQDRR